jgi:hypothetical protein
MLSMRTTSVPAARGLPALLCALALACVAAPPSPEDPAVIAERQAEAVEGARAALDALHRAAAAADTVAYFDLFHPQAVFIGTDPAERWSLADFRAYTEPYFASGRGWTYHSTERHLAASAAGDVVWFDERLQNDKYGEVRGSGVVVATPAGAKIAQYVLSFPVPNELAEDLVTRVRGLNH